MMVDHALAHAARGFFVFPLHGIENGRCTCAKSNCGRNSGKHPQRLPWKRVSTRDPVQIRAWWETWPRANIAIDCGKSGLFIPDVDAKTGGFESLADLVRVHGSAVVDTLTVHTGGGGLHLYFMQPTKGKPFPLSKESDNPLFGPGIDVRGVGGYVAAPGSRHISGRDYVFAPGHDENARPAPCPDALRDVPRQAQKYSLRSSREREGEGEQEAAESESKESSKLGAKRAPKNAPNSEKTPARENFRKNPRAERAEWVDPRPALRAIAGPSYKPPANDDAQFVSPWAIKWEKTPARRDVWKGKRTGTQVHNAALFAQARAYVRAYGPSGKPYFSAALERKRAISPDLDAKPSTKNGDRRNPFAFEPCGRNAWEKALAEPFAEQPIPELRALAKNRKTRGAARLYAVLFLEAIRLGVPVENFRKDSRTLARFLDVSQKTVRNWQALADADQLGILTVTDRGRERTKGDRGISACYALRIAATAAQVETAAIAAALAYVPKEKRHLPAALPTVPHRRRDAA